MDSEDVDASEAAQAYSRIQSYLNESSNMDVGTSNVNSRKSVDFAASSYSYSLSEHASSSQQQQSGSHPYSTNTPIPSKEAFSPFSSGSPYGQSPSANYMGAPSSAGRTPGPGVMMGAPSSAGRTPYGQGESYGDVMGAPSSVGRTPRMRPLSGIGTCLSVQPSLLRYH